MKTVNITQLCSATEMYTETQSALSATNIFPANLTMIWNEVSSTSMGSATLSSFANISLMAQTMAPFVSAM